MNIIKNPTPLIKEMTGQDIQMQMIYNSFLG
jgi:hypothetical protein